LRALLAKMSPDEIAAAVADMEPDAATTLLYDWDLWRRDKQIPPEGDWRVWLVLAGRGFGKTRVGAEWIRVKARDNAIVNLIGATADDARDIMIEGESGILAICPSNERPAYLPSKRRLEWPNGARSLIFTADEPERLRGKQHMQLWCDELAAWRFAEAWDQAMFGLRLGKDPRAVVTTTPKPTKVITSLLALPTTVKTVGTTYENQDNLAPAFLSDILAKYEGTRLGRQELNAELLEDTEGALWTRAILDSYRVSRAPQMGRIVVGVDPSATSGGDEAGVIVAGLDARKDAYVLDDLSIQGSPDAWARQAVVAYHRHKADRLVAESNQGGEMVSQVIRSVDSSVPVTLVHASKGKQARAEPIAALYEQGRVHHVGAFAQLEDELCSWVTGGPSPNRLDALVWALTALTQTGTPQARAI
jgi:phage terminase large subunit-like protein